MRLNGVTVQDVDITTRVTTGTTPAGGSQKTYLVARRQYGGLAYAARVNMDSAGDAYLVLYKLTNTTETTQLTTGAQIALGERTRRTRVSSCGCKSRV